MTSSRAMKIWRHAARNGRASARAARRFPAAPSPASKLLASPGEVNMNPFRLLATTALMALASIASAQSQTDTGRGNTPPGMSRDGASPGDGAITGGSIAPGERGGIPSGRDTNAGREQALKRCDDLEGVL